MKNILFICNSLSIHDYKWISFFSEQKTKFKIFIIEENHNNKTSNNFKNNPEIIILNKLNPFSISKPHKTYKSIKHLNNVILRNNIDFVHVLYACPNALWCNFIKIPYIITTRGSDILLTIPNLKKSKGIRFILGSILFKLFRISFENALTITCTSEVQTIKVKDIFNIKNTKTIKTGVDYDKISNLDKEHLILKALKNKRFIFSPRFFSPVYNIIYQVEAIRFLPQKIIDNYVFLFVKGNQFNNNYFNKVNDLLNQLSVEKGVNFIIIDYFNQEEIWMHFKKASLCIMTPISDGTPNSALEAMASNCPIIISDLDYDKDIFETTCIKTPLNNARKLSELITNTLQDNNIKQMLQNANNAVKTKGNRQIEMKKLEEIYDSI